MAEQISYMRVNEKGSVSYEGIRLYVPALGLADPNNLILILQVEVEGEILLELWEVENQDLVSVVMKQCCDVNSVIVGYNLMQQVPGFEL